MLLSEITDIRQSIYGFSLAIHPPLKQQHRAIYKVHYVLKDALEYCEMAENQITLLQTPLSEHDLGIVKYKLDHAVNELYECFNKIQTIIREHPICAKLSDVLEGMCILLKFQILNLK